MLGFRLEGTLIEPGVFGVVIEVALNRSSLVDIGALLKTVSVTIVLVSVELGASVMVSDGWVSGVMDEVTMLVVEGMTENGVIGADVASVLGLMSTHGVRGELGTMVTVMVSGQGVVEGREI